MALNNTPPSTNRSAPAAPSFDAFLRATQPLSFPLSSQSATNFGDSRTFTADKTGYCESILCYVSGTFTSGLLTNNPIFDPSFFPWNIISRITVQSNNGFQFYNTLGFENAMVQQAWFGKSNSPYSRLNPFWALGAASNVLPTTPLLYTDKGARNFMPTVFNVTDSAVVSPGDTIGASKTYEFSIPYLIPLTAAQDIRAGLCLIQSQSSGLQIQFTVGTSADLVAPGAAGNGAVTLTLSALTITPTQFSFAVPNDPSAQPYAPGQAIRNRWISERVAWSNTGDIDYRYPVGGTIVKSFHHFKNIGTVTTSGKLIPQPYFGTANRPSTPNFGNVKVVYGSTENPMNIPFNHALWQYESQWGTPVPEGVIPFDYGTLSYPDLGINPVGLLNTAGLTEAKTTVNVAGTVTVTAGSVIDVLRQELQMSGGA